MQESNFLAEQQDAVFQEKIKANMKNQRVRFDTNKRRKSIALRRKMLLMKEEKRRQDILEKRREEIREATEKFQRLNKNYVPGVDSRKGQVQIPFTYQGSNDKALQDALKAVKASHRPATVESTRPAGLPYNPNISFEASLAHDLQATNAAFRSPVIGAIPGNVMRPKSAIKKPDDEDKFGSTRLPSGKIYQYNTVDHGAGLLGSTQVKHESKINTIINASDAKNYQHYQQFQRKDAGKDTSAGATNYQWQEMFEKQIVQHQQLMLQQQEQALQHFNNAIKSDIEDDKKLLGEEDEEEETEAFCEESVSSADSLDEDFHNSRPDKSNKAKGTDNKAMTNVNTNTNLAEMMLKQREKSSNKVNYGMATTSANEQPVLISTSDKKPVSEEIQRFTKSTSPDQNQAVKIQTVHMVTKTNVENDSKLQLISGMQTKISETSSSNQVLSEKVPLLKLNPNSALAIANMQNHSKQPFLIGNLSSASQSANNASNNTLSQSHELSQTQTGSKAVGFSFLSSQRLTNSPSNVAIVQPQLHYEEKPAKTSATEIAPYSNKISAAVSGPGSKNFLNTTQDDPSVKGYNVLNLVGPREIVVNQVSQQSSSFRIDPSLAESSSNLYQTKVPSKTLAWADMSPKTDTGHPDLPSNAKLLSESSPEINEPINHTTGSKLSDASQQLPPVSTQSTSQVMTTSNGSQPVESKGQQMLVVFSPQFQPHTPSNNGDAKIAENAKQEDKKAPVNDVKIIVLSDSNKEGKTADIINDDDDDEEPTLEVVPAKRVVKGILKKPMSAQPQKQVFNNASKNATLRCQSAGNIAARDSMDLTREHLQLAAEDKSKKTVRFAAVLHQTRTLFSDSIIAPPSEQPVQLPIDNIAGGLSSESRQTATIRTAQPPGIKTVQDAAAVATAATQQLSNQSSLQPHPPAYPPTGRAILAASRQPNSVKINAAKTAENKIIALSEKPIIIPTATMVAENDSLQKSTASVIRMQSTHLDNTFQMSKPITALGKQPTSGSNMTPSSTNSNADNYQHNQEINRVAEIKFNNRTIPLDRTPTDDEINGLWEDVRNCLGKGKNEESSQTPPAIGSIQPMPNTVGVYGQSKFGSQPIDNDFIMQRQSTFFPSNAHDDMKMTSRTGPLPQKQTYTNTTVTLGASNMNSYNTSKASVAMSQKYIDGSQMGGLTRTYSGMPASTEVIRPQVTLSRPASAKVTADMLNTYSKRAALLQQRRFNQNLPSSANENTNVMHSTIRPISAMPLPSQIAVPAHVDDVSDSMATFLKAEQLSKKSLSESDMDRLLTENQRQPPMAGRFVSPGAPSTLSMEETRLMQSLERLNDRLKQITAAANTGPPVTVNVLAPRSTQPYAIQLHNLEDDTVEHYSGFRGHQPISSTRRFVGRAGNPSRINFQGFLDNGVQSVFQHH